MRSVPLRRRSVARAATLARLTVPAAIMAGLGLLAAGVSHAGQGPQVSYQSGITWRSWDVEKQAVASVSQWRIPYTASIRLTDRVDLTLSGAGAGTDFSTGPSRTGSLNDVAETMAQLFVRLAGNRVMLQVGAQLPQGSQALDSTEVAASSLLAHPLLSFRSRHFGRGFDGHAGLALMTAIGRGARAGISFGQSFRGTYTPFDQGASYHPASESAIAVGIELARPEGSGNLVRLDVAGRTYGTDRRGGADVFAAGNQLELQLLARRTAGPTRVLEGSARIVRRGDDRVLRPGPTEPQEYTPGTWMRGLASFRNRVKGTMWIGIAGEWTHMQGDGRPGRDGDTYGGGPLLTTRLAGNLGLTLEARLLGGALEGSADTGSADFHGRQVSAQLLWRGAP